MFGYTPIAELSYATIREADRGHSVLVNFYFSDRGYISEPTDSIDNQYFSALSDLPISFSRNMVGSDGIGGLVPMTGECRIINADGVNDIILTNYSVEGRSVEIKLGNMDWSYDDFGTIFKGVIADYSLNKESITFYMTDDTKTIKLPIHNDFYAGTGSGEGGSDIEGKPKPLAYGRLFNITPAVVNTTNLLYQVNHGQIQSVDNVYDRGIALTLADQNGGDYASVAALLAATTGGAGSGEDIEAGEYATSLADGYFRLGGTPDGTVTCDAHGDASGDGYVNTTADIIRRILEDQYSFDSSNIDYPSFADTNDDNSSEVGIYIGTEQNTGDVIIEELIKGIGGFAGFNAMNKFQVGVFKVASGATEMTLDETNMEDIEVLTLPSAVNPPNWRRTVGYQKNYTVQNDLASGVTAAQLSFATEAYRFAISSDATVKNNYNLATDPPFVPALFTTEADAQTEADRLLALYKSKRAIYRIKTRFPFRLDLNSVVKIEYDRFGLTNGKYGRVVAITEDAQDYSSEIEVFI